MEKKEILEKLYNSALRFLVFRPRSEREISDFLCKKLQNRSLHLNELSKKEKEECLKETIQRLKEEDLINDKKFVDWWIEQRLEFNPKGKRLLCQELQAKGVARELAEEKLSAINKQQLTIAAKKILPKKQRLYKSLKLWKQKKKLIEHLLRRGFGYNLCLRLVDDFLQKG